jgi:CubicO group peptidase (beta-lactamase class C family)
MTTPSPELVSINSQARHNGKIFPIQGRIAEGFEPLLAAFIANFERGEEVGASAATTENGHLVADLWGGFTDQAQTKAWSQDTIVCMMSVNKALHSLCMFRAQEQGYFKLSDPIVKYWPEFAQHSKSEIPIQWVLDHRSGLPVVEPRLPRGSIYDHAAMAAGFAAMKPLWEPGTQAGYHILSQGFMLAEVLRRTTGKTMGQYFLDELARPLSIDYHMGVPESELNRCAQYLMVKGGTILDEAAQNPDSWQGRAWGQLHADEDFNSRDWRQAEITSANGHGNARAVARLFSALVNGGKLDGYSVLQPASIEAMTKQQHNLTEVVMGRAYHQASGVLRNTPPICWQGPNSNNFGHHGVGGSIVVADPDHRLSFAYGMNQMHPRKDNGPRAGGLIKALYESRGIAAKTPVYGNEPVGQWSGY